VRGVPVEFGGLESIDLTKEQAAKLNAQLRRILRCLNNLEKRMNVLDFPNNDSLLQEAAKVGDAVQTLFIQSHYLTSAVQTAKQACEVAPRQPAARPSRISE
jgi:hypothetical protein